MTLSDSKISSPIWHPFTQHATAPVPTFIDRAQGAYLYQKDGRKIIDAISSWWVITHGHCHPTIHKAVQAQAEKLDQIIFAGFTHEPAEQLAKQLLKRSFDNHEYVFLSDSGSTAVEVALKMAIGYWAQTGKARHKVIALEEGYHGDTFGTMAAGARGVFNKIYEPFLFDVIHTPVPIKGQEDQALDALEKLLKRCGDEVAAFIFEPLVQGAGGMRMYSPETLRAMAELCQRYDILLIADEVMTGFGRTGSFWACEQANIKPDIMAISKGLTGGFLPMGGTLASAKIYDAFYSMDRSKMFFHSSSFTGNPMACAAALASLHIWDESDVIGKINQIKSWHQRAAEIFATHPKIRNIRQRGTILAMDLHSDKSQGYLSEIGPVFYKKALENGLLLRPLGSCIYILPPYCLDEQDAKMIYNFIGNFADSL